MNANGSHHERNLARGAAGNTPVHAATLREVAEPPYLSGITRGLMTDVTGYLLRMFSMQQATLRLMLRGPVFSGTEHHPHART